MLHGLKYTTTRPESPAQPSLESADCDIGPDGEMIAFLSRALYLNQANHTVAYIYLRPFEGSAVPVTMNEPGSEITAAGHEVASGAPTFSPD